MFFTEKRKRIDGVARLGHPKLYIRGSEIKIIFDGQLHHTQAIQLVRQRLLFFEGVLWADYKPNLVKTTALKERLGDNQVSHMYGIETTKVQPYFHA
jgi:hypothetical protein